MMEGMNSTMIYCKNIGKYHNIPPVQYKKIQKKPPTDKRTMSPAMNEVDPPTLS
jgi:hypothetical protein